MSSKIEQFVSLVDESLKAYPTVESLKPDQTVEKTRVWSESGANGIEVRMKDGAIFNLTITDLTATN